MKLRGQASLRIAIALVVGLVVAGAPAIYFYEQNASLATQNSSLSSQVASDSTTIRSLRELNASIHAQVASLQAELASNQSNAATLQERVTSLQTQLDDLQALNATQSNQIASLQGQIASQNSVLSLSSDTVWWYNDGNSCGGSFQCGAFYGPFTTQYAGYVVVSVSIPTPENDYVQVTWSSYGVGYNTTQNIGHSADVAFAVLPASNLMVTVAFYGNVTVSITYYY